MEIKMGVSRAIKMGMSGALMFLEWITFKICLLIIRHNFETLDFISTLYALNLTFLWRFFFERGKKVRTVKS